VWTVSWDRAEVSSLLNKNTHTFAADAERGERLASRQTSTHGSLACFDIKPIEPPHDQPDYFFDKDMADHTIARIQMLHAVAPDKPWVTYYAPGTAHAPHHAPKEWIAKYKGKFDNISLESSPCATAKCARKRFPAKRR
jgi:arylsulfatase A-like enzyme